MWRPWTPLRRYSTPGGRSNLAGEHRVLAGESLAYVILRTACLYSPHGNNFVRTRSSGLHKRRERLTVVDDQLGCPTAERDLAQACPDIALGCAAEPDRAPYGLYHFAGGGAATWFEFACAIVERAAGQLRRVPQVVPIRTAQRPTPAPRPADSRLDCTAIATAFGLTPRPWRHALAETVDCIFTRKSVAVKLKRHHTRGRHRQPALPGNARHQQNNSYARHDKPMIYYPPSVLRAGFRNSHRSVR